MLSIGVRINKIVMLLDNLTYAEAEGVLSQVKALIANGNRLKTDTKCMTRTVTEEKS